MASNGRTDRVNVCVVVFFSVLLLAVCVDRAGADLGWLSGASNTDVLLSWSRARTDDASTRRVLASSNGYIGYGALTAGRTPCPPQSGRSYYTPNCRSATGPVRPYQRGCSAITRCARG
ncbi:unnamed protein product [Calypogeia fissa]